MSGDTIKEWDPEYTESFVEWANNAIREFFLYSDDKNCNSKQDCILPAAERLIGKSQAPVLTKYWGDWNPHEPPTVDEPNFPSELLKALFSKYKVKTNTVFSYRATDCSG